MKKRAIIAFVLVLSMIFALCSCGQVAVKDNTNTNTNTNTNSSNQGGTDVKQEPITLRLAYASKNEKDANIVRDLLTKKGFVVEMNAQADNAGVQAVAESGEYDVILHASANSAYSIDYALKQIVYPGGALNWTKIDDPVLNQMIDDAAATTKDQWDEVYSEIEEYMVEEMVYSTPLYRETQGVASSAAVDVTTYKPNMALGYMDYLDTSLRASRTLKFGFNATASQFPTMDPVRASSGASNYSFPWCYAYLLRYDASVNDYTTRGALSQSYAVSESGDAFYFLLRGDCFFSRVNEDGEAYVTDHLVAGEDVVYSILRAADRNSVAGNVGYNNFTSVEDCVIVTDIAELKNTKTAEGKSILDALNASTKTTMKTLAATRDDVNTGTGAYQVVRIDTKYPFAQLLNYLNTAYAGIVDSEWVESINSKVDMANYNAEKDWLYGDTKNIYLGNNFYNDGSFSGHYVLVSADDYGLKLVKNEGFATEGDPNYDQALVTNAEMVYTANATAAFTALRGGDIDFVTKLNNADISVAKEDSSINMQMIDGAGLHYLMYNRSEDSVCSDVLVRKAISGAINQADIIAGIGNAQPANSIITVGYKTSNTFDYDENATQKYLDEYWASKG